MFAPEDPIRWVTETDGKRWRLGRPDAVERFEEGLAELECNLAQGSTVTGDRLAHIGSSLEWGVEALTEESWTAASCCIDSWCRPGAREKGLRKRACFSRCCRSAVRRSYLSGGTEPVNKFETPVSII